MYNSITLIKTSEILHCKYIGLCYALGQAMNNSKRDSVDRNGSHADNVYRMSEVCGICTVVSKRAFNFGSLASLFFVRNA